MTTTTTAAAAATATATSGQQRPPNVSCERTPLTSKAALNVRSNDSSADHARPRTDDEDGVREDGDSDCVDANN